MRATRGVRPAMARSAAAFQPQVETIQRSRKRYREFIQESPMLRSANAATG